MTLYDAFTDELDKMAKAPSLGRTYKKLFMRSERGQVAKSLKAIRSGRTSMREAGLDPREMGMGSNRDTLKILREGAEKMRKRRRNITIGAGAAGGATALGTGALLLKAKKDKKK